MNIQPPPPPYTTIKELPELDKVSLSPGIYMAVLNTKYIDKIKFKFNGVMILDAIIYSKLYLTLLKFIQILGFNKFPTIKEFCIALNNKKYNNKKIKLTKDDILITNHFSNKYIYQDIDCIIIGRNVYFDNPCENILIYDETINEYSEYCHFIDFITALQKINSLTDIEKNELWNTNITNYTLYNI